MTSFILTSNAQLYSYLCCLADELRCCNEVEAADVILLASKFASGSPSEFLHESQVALQEIRSTCARRLTSDQLKKITSVIKQIDDAFHGIGGA